MPIYEYECVNCGKRFEELRDMDDESVLTCETCSSPCRKLVSVTTFQLKGEGWFANKRIARTVTHDPYDCVGRDGEPCDPKTGNKL